jgi:hypothetical protein
VAGDQRHERVGAARRDAIRYEAGFLFAGPLDEVGRLGCGVGGGRCAFRYLCLDRRDQLRPVLGGEAGAEFEGAVVGPPPAERPSRRLVLGWGDELAGGVDEAFEVGGGAVAGDGEQDPLGALRVGDPGVG